MPCLKDQFVWVGLCWLSSLAIVTITVQFVQTVVLWQRRNCVERIMISLPGEPIYFDPETLQNGDTEFDWRTLAGVPVTPHVRKSGKYLLGPKLGISPVKSIVQCLGRLDGTLKYYQVRVTLACYFISSAIYIKQLRVLIDHCLTTVEWHILERCARSPSFIFSKQLWPDCLRFCNGTNCIQKFHISTFFTDFFKFLILLKVF